MSRPRDVGETNSKFKFMSFISFFQIMVLMHVKVSTIRGKSKFSSQTLMSHMEELPYYTPMHNIFHTILRW